MTSTLQILLQKLQMGTLPAPRFQIKSLSHSKHVGEAMHAFALNRQLKKCLKYMKTSYYSSGWRLKLVSAEKFPHFTSVTAEENVYLTTLSGANWLFLTFLFVMLDPLKTIKHCSFEKKTLLPLSCGRQAAHKPVLASGALCGETSPSSRCAWSSTVKTVLLICYKGVTDENGLRKTIPAAVGCGESPECSE